MRTAVTAFFSVFLLASIMMPPAHAAELLSDVTGVPAVPALQPDKTIKRQRLVNVSATGLAEAIVPPGFDVASDRVERSARRSGKVSLKLFDDATVDLQRSRVEAGLDGGVIWEGDSESGDSGILVVHNGQITGHVERRGRNYLIDPAGTGPLHRVREIDPNAYPRDKHVEVPSRPAVNRSQDTSVPSAPAAVTPTEITLLATYTQRARNRLGANFADKISLDVARINRALQNSGGKLRIRLVGSKPVSSNYDELASADPGAPLDAITTGTSYNFPSLRQWRTTLSADLVTMYTMRPEYCGLAWVNYPGVSATYSFSVINARCQGSLSLAHEIGHNMGLNHDRYVENAAPVSQYNFGYVDVIGRFRDIMSYSDRCDDSFISCQEIAYYSTPLRSYQGRPVGIPSGSAGAADATRLLNENRAAISRFR